MKALYVADQLVKAGKGDVYVLVLCVELCSLHLKRPTSKTTLIANSLFADGCASCIVGSVKQKENSYEGMYMINNFNTKRVPESKDMITWDLGESTFDMFMDRNVHTAISPYVKKLFEKNPNKNLQYNDFNYCIHPGGITILEGIAYALGLERSKLDYSYEVLRNRGNMSSCTVLYVLDLIRNKEKSKKDIVMIGAGPGVSLEFCQLTVLNVKPSSNFVDLAEKTKPVTTKKQISPLQNKFENFKIIANLMYKKNLPILKHYFFFIIVLILSIYLF